MSYFLCGGMGFHTVDTRALQENSIIYNKIILFKSEIYINFSLFSSYMLHMWHFCLLSKQVHKLLFVVEQNKKSWL